MAAHKPAQSHHRRPNLLIIMTDQQSSWTLGCYGAREIATPHIDSLAKEGARLTNFFTNSACCTPSRGCFFTGLYPHQHGAHFNDLPLRRDAVTTAQVLRRHGYDTGYIGKWHLDGDWQSLSKALEAAGISPEALRISEADKVPGERARLVPRDRAMGFDDCRRMFNCSHAKEVVESAGGRVAFDAGGMGDESTYMTDWLTSRAIEFITCRREHPFFLTLAIPDPHDPFSVRAPYDTMFPPEELAIPETFRQTDLPDWMYEQGVTIWHRPEAVVGSEQALRKAKAQYLGEVKCIDDNVGRILAALEQNGILENTIVVFTTDHGEYMGEHGIYAKNQLYETAYRIPFLARYPKLIPAGRSIDEFVTTVDIHSTLLGFLDIPEVATGYGRDASPLLRGEKIDWENEAFIYGTTFNRTGIFTPDFELAYVKGAADHILFDRRSDPLQANNLFRDPALQGITAELTERLIEHNGSIGAPETAWLRRCAART